MIGIGHHGVPWEARCSGDCDNADAEGKSTQYNLQESYSVKCGVGIAAIWVVFYAAIGVAGMVVHGVSSVAALH